MRKDDKVMKVVGSSILLGSVVETRLIDGWCCAKVEWAESAVLERVREGLVTDRPGCAQSFDPDAEWIRHDQLLKIDPDEVFRHLVSLYHESCNDIVQLQR